MVLDRLGESLKNSLQKIANAVFVDEKLINELVKDIQRALLQADVNVKLVFELSKKIKDRALQDKIPPGLTKKEYLINVVYEELVKFLGGEGYKIQVSKKPFKIMLVGLFGHGKTTSATKLAKFFQKRGHTVAVISTDTWRPAAYEQLKQNAEKINADCYGNPKAKKPEDVYTQYKDRLQKYDVVIIDTAGRDALNKELVEELIAIYKTVKPDENLLVMGADTGQAAQSQAETFHKHAKVTGVFITKLDGTAKGGGALSACSVTGAPVKFIGVGEKIDDLEVFNPKGFVGRLLGMGDLEALLDKAKHAITEEEAQDLGERMIKGDFNLIDLYQQMEAMNKMGPLGKVMEMIPGMGQLKLPKDMIHVQEGKLKAWKHIMNSCTKEELEDAELIDRHRAERIAKGAGCSVSDVRELTKQYRMAKKMMKMFKGGNPQQMMKKMKGRLPPGFNIGM